MTKIRSGSKIGGALGWIEYDSVTDALTMSNGTSTLTVERATTAGVSAMIAALRGAANGLAPLDADSKIPAQYISQTVSSQVVADIAARDAITSPAEALMVTVLDASADTTVTAGAATYIRSSGAWVKIAEVESMDLVQSWENITGKPATFPPAMHSHATSDVTGLDTALAEKLTTPAGGAVDQVLKKTADGVEWGDSQGMTDDERARLLPEVTDADGGLSPVVDVGAGYWDIATLDAYNAKFYLYSDFVETGKIGKLQFPLELPTGFSILSGGIQGNRIVTDATTSDSVSATLGKTIGAVDGVLITCWVKRPTNGWQQLLHIGQFQPDVSSYQDQVRFNYKTVSGTSNSGSAESSAVRFSKGENWQLFAAYLNTNTLFGSMNDSVVTGTMSTASLSLGDTVKFYAENGTQYSSIMIWDGVTLNLEQYTALVQELYNAGEGRFPVRYTIGSPTYLLKRVVQSVNGITPDENGNVPPAPWTTLDYAAAVTVPANAPQQKMTLTGNCTLTAPALTENQRVRLKISGTGQSLTLNGTTTTISGAQLLEWFHDGTEQYMLPVQVLS